MVLATRICRRTQLSSLDPVPRVGWHLLDALLLLFRGEYANSRLVIIRKRGDV